MYSANDRDTSIDWRYNLRWASGAMSGPVIRFALHYRAARFARRVGRRRVALRDLDVARLGTALQAERGRVRPDRLTGRTAVRAMALVAELSHCVLGLDPFPMQIRGAAVLLSGGVAEMPTGSGKTLTAALASVTAALSGFKVHVITANDYLAERDATELGPLYEAAGISIGLITRAVPQSERPSAYRRDVVYASNKEIAFDYLRNRIALGADSGRIRTTLEPLHRRNARSALMTMYGLPFAIVDEADSVLIDECRTPLIISANAEPDPEAPAITLSFGDALEEAVDYVVEDRQRTVQLTDRGRCRLDALGEEAGGIWRNGVRREKAARQGIVARRFFHRDVHYIVRDERVELIDEYTGRVAVDRALGDGLHQVIEAKEGVQVSGRRFTQGRITYQRFFRRYRRLVGMTGTAREVTGELRTVYGVHVIPLRPHHRTRRAFRGNRIYWTERTKWQRMVKRVRRMGRRGKWRGMAANTAVAPSRSWMSAPWTTTATSRPPVSVRM